MTAHRPYLVDSDVLITAKNLYYAFDICPAFWKCLIQQHQEDLVFSIDWVRNELLAGRETEDLVRWVKSEVPEGFFLAMDSEEVARVYTETMPWVQRHPSYFDQAKANFATGADGLRRGARCNGRDERVASPYIPAGREGAGCLRHVRCPLEQLLRDALSAGSAVRLSDGLRGRRHGLEIRILSGCVGLGLRCMIPNETRRRERARFVPGTTRVAA